MLLKLEEVNELANELMILETNLYFNLILKIMEVPWTVNLTIL